MKDFDLNKYNACDEAIEFCNAYNTFKGAWEACPRGDWMLWIVYKLRVDKRLLILAKALCAKTIVHLMKDERSINAVKVAETYGRGEATEEELSFAAADAYAAYVTYADADTDDAAYAAAAAYVAYAVGAVDAAYTTDDADDAYVAYAADAAYADAAYADAYATANAAAYATAADAAYTDTAYVGAYTYAANAAEKENQQQTADICRQVLTDAVFKLIK